MIKFLALFFIILFSHVVETTTGFGATVIALSLGAFIYPERIKELVIVLVIIACLQSLFIVARNFRSIQWHYLLRILLLAGLGIPFGIWFYHSLPVDTLKICLALFIITSAGIQLFFILLKKSDLKPFPAYVSFLLLGIGGFIHGIFATGGPMVVLYASRTITQKGEFRATLSALWLILGLILLSNYLWAGQINRSVLFDAILLLPALVVGIALGEYAHHRVNERIFRLAVQVTLMITGAFLLMR